MSFAVYAVASVVGLVLLAALRRGRFFAIFTFVMFGVHSLILSAILPEGPAALRYVFFGLHGALITHFASLNFPAMRPFLYRLVVTWPAHGFLAGTLLAFPLALLEIFVDTPTWALAIPYGLALIGVAQSLLTPRSVVDLVLDGRAFDTLSPVRPLPQAPVSESDAAAKEEPSPPRRPLRIVQITDPHLGPYMSEARLRRIAERAVADDPDLVLMTGDFLTMESHRARDVVARAFEPLRALEGRVFACHGNHDHEARSTVRGGLVAAGVTLLVDEEAVVSTPAGDVQIIGADYRFRNRKEHLAQLASEFPRRDGALRLWMLHDPGAFKHVPEGEGDLVLAGHTHGGQLGLVTRRFSWTPVWNLVGMPDQGLFARGRDRLYVHRGTGVYGFPVRLGVPAEEGVLRVHWGM